MTRIYYTSGYKYQLKKSYSHMLTRHFEIDSGLDYIKVGSFIWLYTEGYLVINAGYAWDGPSGPTVDTASFMRASLVHDVLYQIMRYGVMGKGNRKNADKTLRDICIEDGMNRWRAHAVYHGLRFGGASAADPESRKKIHTAP